MKCRSLAVAPRVRAEARTYLTPLVMTNKNEKVRKSVRFVARVYANWRKNRVSPSKYSWMSSTLYFIAANRSTPMPNAKPLTFDGS